MATLVWERVFEDIIDSKGHKEAYGQESKVMRAKVPGGWLLRVLEIGKGTVGMVFISDQGYTWEK